jgi:hypothetical protein
LETPVTITGAGLTVIPHFAAVIHDHESVHDQEGTPGICSSCVPVQSSFT